MTDGSNPQMTIPELLEAREKVRRQLEISPNYAVYDRGFASGSNPERDELQLILEEIEAELAERGHKDAQES
jgi:hypothetical protein